MSNVLCTMRNGFIAAVVGFMFLGAVPVEADAVYSDGTFNLSNYSISTYQTGGATINISQILSGGDPGSALQISTTIPSPLGNSFDSRSYVINNTFLYNPSTQGTAQNVGVSVDVYRLLSQNPSLVGFSPVIYQDGNYYAYYTIVTSYDPGVYQNASADLLASQFSLITNLSSGAVNSAAHPNFGGDPMEFGFSESLASSGVSATITGTFQYDNLTFDVASAAATATAPEPGGSALMALGLMAVGIGFRRSKSRRRESPVRVKVNDLLK